MLVRAPVATSQAVLGGVEERAWNIARTAGILEGAERGVGRRRVPSRPEAPWIEGAWTAGRVRPLGLPGWTGIEGVPRAVRRERALWVVWARELLP